MAVGNSGHLHLTTQVTLLDGHGAELIIKHRECMGQQFGVYL